MRTRLVVVAKEYTDLHPQNAARGTVSRTAMPLHLVVNIPNQKKNNAL
jgi:hypothetical protein